MMKIKMTTATNMTTTVGGETGMVRVLFNIDQRIWGLQDIDVGNGTYVSIASVALVEAVVTVEIGEGK